MADLAAEVHGKLPHDHDPLWDGLARIGRPLTESLAIGTSAGLAYHFLVDALIQPAALHGLPVHMPIEGHQAVMAASGMAEGANVAGHTGWHESTEIVQGDPRQKSTGRKVVDAVGETAAAVKTAVSGGAQRLGNEFRKWKNEK